MKTLKSSFRWITLFVLAAAFLFLGTVNHAFAAGVVGNGTPASCTEAAFDTALANQVEKIKFNCGPAIKTITLTTTKLIQYTTQINGGNKIVLEAKNVPHFRFDVQKVYTLKNLTFKGGKGESGGAILNHATLVLSNVKFDNNQALYYGGAIYNTGTLTVRKSAFTNNRAKSGGGAIYTLEGTLNISNSSFTGNVSLDPHADTFGGALLIKDSDVTIEGTTFSKNTAVYGSALLKYSGALNIRRSKFIENKATNTATIYVFEGAGLLEDSLVDHNTASEVGGILTISGLDIIRSTISNNAAQTTLGGVGSIGGRLNLADSTISGNTADFVGGLYLGADFFINNSTISGNRSNHDAGGVLSFYTGLVLNSTLSGNKAGPNGKGGGWYQVANSTGFTYVTVANNQAKSGAGIFLDKQELRLKSQPVFHPFAGSAGAPEIENSASLADNSIHLQNTLFAKNTGGNCRSVESDIASQGYNLSDDATCQDDLNATGDLNRTNAKLGPLADNGGPTLTHMPLKGSKAIDGGLALLIYRIDQRRYARPFKTSSDIGAVEAGSSEAE